jgi:WD40 repeat protein
LNDIILLSVKDGDIIEWEISENNLKLVGKKEKSHQSSIIEIIRFNNSIASCSNDNTIKIWLILLGVKFVVNIYYNRLLKFILFNISLQ